MYIHVYVYTCMCIYIYIYNREIFMGTALPPCFLTTLQSTLHLFIVCYITINHAEKAKSIPATRTQNLVFVSKTSGI